MRRIKIANIGWNGSEAPKSLEDVTSGIKVPWVELHVDGQSIRIPAEWICGVEVHSSGGEFTTVQLSLCGAPEYVYTDRKGNPL